MSWPPPNQSIEARPLEAVLADHADLIRRLRLCFGESPQCFDELLLPLVQRYARYVHCLPATASAHFCSPGGLLRLGLEVGFFSLQGCDVRIFSGSATMERRRVMEPRWRLAAFIAGLCCELYRAPGQLVAMAPQGQTWPWQLQPLWDWLQQHAIVHYSVQWRHSKRPLLPWGLLVLNHIVTPENWAYLGHDNDAIIPDLLCSVAGLAMGENVLDDLVRHALAVVVDQDLKRQFAQDGRDHHAQHLKHYILEVLQQLMSNHPRWQINEPDSMVLRGSQGCYLRWPLASKWMLTALASVNLPGLPDNVDDLLRQMEDMGLVTRPDPSKFYSLFTDSHVVSAVRFIDTPWLLHALSPARRGAMSLPAPTEAENGVGDDGQEAQGEQEHLDAAEECAMSHGEEGESENPSPPAPEAPTAEEGPEELAPDATSAEDQVPGTPLRWQFVGKHLPARLKEALIDLVRTLNSANSAEGVLMLEQGLFVPNAALKSRGFDPSYVIRQLRDQGVLIPGRDGPRTELEFNGKPVSGVVVAPRCLQRVEA